MASQAGVVVGAVVAVPYGISKFVNELCDKLGLPKTIVLDLCIGWNTLVLFLLFICSCVMSGTVKYYTDPPAVGDGLDTLWSVDQGDAFSIIFPPLAIMFFNIIALIAINCSWCNDMRYGIFTGISMAFVVQLLQIMVEWGTQAVMLEDLAKDYDLSAMIGIDQGSFPVIKKSAIETAQAITVFSAMLFLFQIVQTIVLMIFKDAVVEGDSPCAMREPQGDGQFAGLGTSNQPFASQNSDDL
tara:strand:- start:10 stop:735 length:726 start_codon:yes stop_codon:yes gene_type:complete